MKILFLAHRIPYPPNKGDKIRSFHQLRHLARESQVFLGTTLDRAADAAYLDALRPYCEELQAVQFGRRWRLAANALNPARPFSVAYFHHGGLQGFVDRVLEEQQIDAVFCFCSSMAEYVYRTPRFRRDGLAGIRTVMDFVDLDSDKWHQYASYTKFPLSLLYQIEHQRLFRYECRINNTFDQSVFVSQREEVVFRRDYPAARNVSVVSNGVDTEYFQPGVSALPKDAPTLVFTGVMDYFANEDGVRWFAEAIYPRIRSQIPDARFYVVGNHPTTAVWRLAALEGVTVTGYVEDIRDYYWLADVCVIPLRIARGLQNKVLEAMATGCAIVATTNATDGIECRKDEELLIADAPDEFAASVVGLLENPERRRELGQKARENVCRNYDWDTNLAKLDELLR